MEILFKSSYTRSKEMMKEMYRFFCFKRKSFLVAYILMAIPFFASLYYAISGQPYNSIPFFFVPLLIMFQVCTYFRQVNAVLKRDKELYGKEAEIEVIATQDFIQSTDSKGVENRIEYNNIKSAVQTKNMILLCSKAGFVYIFKKYSFDIGTKEDFLSFLKTKGIIVKGK